jgi:ABC-type transport system involved in cytochrome bd biosynthesis fused ATPase/permease subunit
MGPSGAGKSSLLNVLAGRSSSVGEIKISGVVRINLLYLSTGNKISKIGENWWQRDQSRQISS